MQQSAMARWWMQAHNYTATFFLPVALLYAVTGGLYILGVHGTLRQRTLQVVTEQPLSADVDALKSVVESQLREHGFALPQGPARMVHGAFLWGPPTGYHVALEKETGSNTAAIHCKTPGLYSRLVMLHKAKCGKPFKILGMVFAVAMTLIYLSGVVIVWQRTSLRQAFLAALACGTVTVVLVVLLSV